MQLSLPINVTAQYSYVIWLLLNIGRSWKALLTEFSKPFGFGLFCFGFFTVKHF